MSTRYTSANGRISVELTGSTSVSVFEQISLFQEVFEQTKCGKCGSEDLKFNIRTTNGDKYYELICNECGARLAFGCNKEGGGMYPQRKFTKSHAQFVEGEANYKPDNGWCKWNKTTNKEE
jgi:ribosomal protein L40E